MACSGRGASSTTVAVTRWTAAIVVVWVVGGEFFSSWAMVAQQPSAVRAAREHVVIPFLANAGKPTDLNFEGGECDVDESGEHDGMPVSASISHNLESRTAHLPHHDKSL